MTTMEEAEEVLVEALVVVDVLVSRTVTCESSCWSMNFNFDFASSVRSEGVVASSDINMSNNT